MNDDKLYSIVKVSQNSVERYSNDLIRRALNEIKLLEQSISNNKNKFSPIEWYEKGLIAAKNEEDEIAIYCYKKAIELNPRYTEAYSSIGTPYERQGKYEEAIICYRKAIDLNPKDWYPYFMMGYDYEKLCNYDMAIELYKKFLEVDRNAGGNFIYYRIGFSYLQKGDKEKAIEWYKIAAKLGHIKTQELLAESGYEW